MTTLDAAESAGPFIGRERETGILLEALNQADAGRGQLILVGREPGIGKSRLVDEFAARARDRGAGILWGRAWEEAGAPAYWPWIQALRAHLRGVVPDTARNQLGLGAADIAQMLPEIRTIVPDVPPPQPDSDAARFQLFDSTTSFLRNVARDRATVLVLEDLHAADAPSILLLRFVASQLAEMRLLAVATYRDIELSPADPLARALVEMVREPAVRVLGLDGLREAAVDELIRSAAGVTPSHRLARNLWLETKGNPLFVGEAIRLLAAEGRLAEMTTGGTVHLAIPAGVREVIRRRVRRLSKETVETLAVGAALGPEFGAETLRRVGPHPPDRLLELLNEAIGAGLLAPVTGTAARFRFSHDLIREALYQETPPSARPRLHARIAETLEEMHARALEGHFAELAHHYHEAARGSELVGGREADTAFVEKALIYARRRGPGDPIPGLRGGRPAISSGPGTDRHRSAWR